MSITDAPRAPNCLRAEARMLLHSIPVFPSVRALVPVRKPVRSLSVLCPICPLPVIFAAVGPTEDAFATLDVILVLACVASAIWPGKSALSMYMIVFPLSTILTTIAPSISALAMNPILIKLALICRPIWPDEFASSVFFTSSILALVSGLVCPVLDTLTILYDIPLSIVPRAICMKIRANAMHPITQPLALITVAVSSHESAPAMRYAFNPATFVLASIGPELIPIPMTRVALPFSGIPCTILKDVSGPWFIRLAEDQSYSFICGILLLLRQRFARATSTSMAISKLDALTFLQTLVASAHRERQRSYEGPQFPCGSP